MAALQVLQQDWNSSVTQAEISIRMVTYYPKMVTK